MWFLRKFILSLVKVTRFVYLSLRHQTIKITPTLKLFSAIFYQIFIFHQMTVLQKL